MAPVPLSIVSYLKVGLVSGQERGPNDCKAADNRRPSRRVNRAQSVSICR